MSAGPQTAPASPPAGRNLRLAGAAIAGGALLAYANTFTAPFVFDDIPSIAENATIRQLATAFVPPAGGLTVSGRPLLNLSLALNQAISGDAVWSYHALNLLIHLLAALTLFGLVRRTLRLPLLAVPGGAAADWVALAIAGLWAVHPLQTESVTYVVQRAESLAGLLYLLTLYCFVRSAPSDRPARWLAAGALAGLLGACAKETLATLPLVALLYDRTFLSGSFRAAWGRHRPFHLALAGGWVVLGALVFTTANRGGTTGFATPVAAWQYALIQLHAVAHYLRLAVWPATLVFDSGPFQSVPRAAVALGAIVVIPALVLTGFALRRRPALGFAGAWFFLTLAPSSSVVPVASQVMAEHRMYLALAAVVTLVVLLLWRALGRAFPGVVLGLALLCAARTWQRNADYQSPLQLWTVTARDEPANPRAFVNLAQALVAADRWPEAADALQAALQLQPGYVAAHYALGLVEIHSGRFDVAAGHFAAALRGNPAMADAAYNWGNALASAGRPADAAERYQYALALQPDHAAAHYNLGNTLVALGRPPEAIAQYRAAVRLDAGLTAAHFNLGNALAETGQFAAAAAEYEIVLRLTPQDAEAARNLALVRAETGAPRP